MTDVRPTLPMDAPVPTGYLRNAPVLARLMFRTSEAADGCWIWRGSTDRFGYGEIGLGGDKGPTRKVHRVAYEQMVGPIPTGLTLDHLCRNTSCVNPAHLEPVPLRVNLARGWEHRRADGQCVNGHSMTPENTSASKKNRCRECARIRNRAYKSRLKDAS